MTHSPARWFALFLIWPLASLADGLPDFTGLVKKYAPAVVNISTVQHERLGRFHHFNLPDVPEDSPLKDFIDRFLGDRGGEGEDGDGGDIPTRSLGSGFFITADGYILTNRHVVDGAEEVIVRTSDRREFKARLIGADERSDVALLKIDAKDMPVARIGNSKDLEVGEWVLAIGSPFGFDHSVTAGIVSAKGRSLPNENYIPFIQTDVAINPGNSGGPLIDMDGEVVGVNAQIYSRTGGFMGLSFAIPIELAMNVARQLRTQGHVTRGWLGVMIQDLTRPLADSFGQDRPRGALVAKVLPDSPALKAGLQVGDVILSFNGHAIATSSELPPLVGSAPVDKAADLEVLRAGKRLHVQVTIGELPEEVAAAGGGHGSHKAMPQAAGRLGLSVRDPSAEERKALGLGADTGGVLVTHVGPGAARRAGIRRGDLILMLANRTVSDAKAFHRQVEALPAGRPVAVLIQRQDGRLFLPVEVPGK